MVQLNTTPLYRTYYVNDGVIYEIKNTTKPSTDIHAIIYDKDSSFPRLLYQDKKEVTHIFYLDSLIKDGDKLSESAFTKVCHELDGEPEKTPFEYFKSLCELQMAKVIGDNPGRKYSYYYDEANHINKLSEFGVPDYMFKQNYDELINPYRFDESDGARGKRVAKDDLIDFTESLYNQLLEEEIYRRTKAAANKVANKYDKKVGTLTLTGV